jgi:hypothetical protein
MLLTLNELYTRMPPDTTERRHSPPGYEGRLMFLSIETLNVMVSLLPREIESALEAVPKLKFWNSFLPLEKIA